MNQTIRDTSEPGDGWQKSNPIRRSTSSAVVRWIDIWGQHIEFASQMNNASTSVPGIPLGCPPCPH
jgi:hypothetical protein